MRKRPTTSKLNYSRVVVDVWQRVLGRLPATSFTHRLIASQDFVLRFDLYRKLQEHGGCVNTVSFDTNGEILVSASDDRKVIFWDWENGCVRLTFNYGHTNNVFQAKIIPYTHDQDIITCAADGHIRYAQVLEGGKVETKLLGKHQGRAHMLAVEPDNPHIFYSCGEDGLVQHYAIATQEGSIYQGAEAFITVWNPKVRGPVEFSLSQIWVASGPNPVNTIEVGWTVCPKKFHDSQTRLFTYWTQDSYIRTGCYNLDCPGFVQTNRRITLGGALRPTSVYGRESYDIHINIARDRETDRWWIKIAGETLGYFPSNHFNSLRKGANLKVDFGGEIINNKDGNRHTATQMGSGHFATEGYKKSSLIRNIKVVNNEYDIVDASLEPDVTIPECYNLHFGPPETSFQTHFYFGGPGYSNRCQ